YALSVQHISPEKCKFYPADLGRVRLTSIASTLPVTYLIVPLFQEHEADHSALSHGSQSTSTGTTSDAPSSRLIILRIPIMCIQGKILLFRWLIPFMMARTIILGHDP
ncbi:hypothetical protein A2U01_0003675, partial [Trifolium medium]|nr:hypothetical protein [Trifolium medium]